MPDYATTSSWFNWAVFVAAFVYLLVTLRPVDWGAIWQSLGMTVLLLTFGFGIGALMGDGDLQTMLLLKNGRMEEISVAGGYAFLLYAILAMPIVLIKQAIANLKRRRHSPNETESTS